jgi:cell division protein FtsB
MASAKKKDPRVDPISARAQSLNEQIAALETEIKKLDTQLQRPPAAPVAPRFRSTAMPHGATIPNAAEKTAPIPPAASEPIFEKINHQPLQARNETEAPDHYNELGVRKYDLPALWHRLRNHLRGPTTTNPRLVNYLAAGGVHGLRPLRYEKRVARNRFIFFAAALFLLLLGLFLVFLHNH